MSRSKDNFLIVEGKPSEEDKVLDVALRPRAWNEFYGQQRIKKNLQIIIDAAKKRQEAPEHLLFYGNSGLGKTTISYLIAKELGANLRVTSGPAIERPGDLAAILTNLTTGDVLFIDECHRLNKIVEEYLYSAMEEFKLNLIVGRGPMAQTMEIPIAPFTLIGATTRIALLSAPLRSRFGATFQLDFYETNDLAKIITRSANILKIAIDEGAATLIAQRSRFTPRVANRLLKRVRDFVQVEGKNKIDEKSAKAALEFLEIDHLGLESTDRKILKTLITKFSGGPVGLQALSAASGEEEDTILDIHEPYLMRLGFIERTPRGRIATEAAWQHLNIKYKPAQNQLL